MAPVLPRLVKTTLAEVVLVELEAHDDDRGRVIEAFREPWPDALGVPATAFVQDNVTWSRRSALRGLHYRIDNRQGKLVHVIDGRVFDAIVDVRRGSPTFGRWCGLELSGDLPRLLWIPPGFAHGYLTLSEASTVAYKLTAPYDPTTERCVRWDDPAIGIAWPDAGPIVLSARDRAAPVLAAAELPG